jgi:hypothetical protein
LLQAGAAGKASKDLLAAAQLQSQTQTGIANAALNYGSGVYNIGFQGIAPFLGMGTTAANILGTQLPTLTQAPTITADMLNNIPGYDWVKQQGTEAMTSIMGAMRESGPAAKSVGQYVTGLANQNWQQLYEDILQGKQQAYGMLGNAANIGTLGASSLFGAGSNLTNAASGTLGSLSSNLGGAITAGGAAGAAGQLGPANALASGLGSLGGAAQSYATINALINAGAFGQQNNALLGVQGGQNIYAPGNFNQTAWDQLSPNWQGPMQS